MVRGPGGRGSPPPLGGAEVSASFSWQPLGAGEGGSHAASRRPGDADHRPQRASRPGLRTFLRNKIDFLIFLSSSLPMMLEAIEHLHQDDYDHQMDLHQIKPKSNQNQIESKANQNHDRILMEIPGNPNKRTGNPRKSQLKSNL